MKLHICIFSILFFQVALAEYGWSSFAEGFSSTGTDAGIEISHRMHTAPSLTELGGSGKVVDRLEIEPRNISVRVGDIVPYDTIRIVAFDDRNQIVQKVPLSFSIEGPSELLDYEAFITYGEGIVAVRSGKARIWVDSLLPTSSGGSVREYFTLTIE